MSDDNDVGYGKPPKHTRWKKGQSGNPKGRPAKPDATSLDVASVLDEPVPVKIDGSEKKMSGFEASIRKLAHRAITDKDLNAALEFIKFCDKYQVIAPTTAGQRHGVAILPDSWNEDEWYEMLRIHGAPPWPGKRSGLPGS